MRKILFLTIMALAAASAAANVFLDALPPVSTIAPGYAESDSVKMRMAAAPLSAVEGMWQMLDGGALFALERFDEPSVPSAHRTPAFRLVMVKAPSLLVRPGTVIGHAVATAKPDVYEARIYTDFAMAHSLGIPRMFTLHLAADGSTLTFKPRKSRITMNLFRLLPYMYRHVFRLRDNRPDDLDGAIKVYPAVVSQRFGPRYL